MNRILLIVLASFLVMTFPEIFRATQNASRKAVPMTPLRQIVPEVRTPSLPNSRITDRMRIVVRDRAAWISLWNQINNLDPRQPLPDFPPLPEIDFSREMLIVAAMGQQPSSGYSIIIEEVYANDRNDRCEVVVRSFDRTKCLGQAAVIVSPVDIVRVPRSDCTAVFSEQEDVTCGPLYSPTTPGRQP